jgi:hypothetical protein
MAKETYWHTLPIRICLLASLLFCIYLCARRAAGAWRFRQGSPDAIQSAMRWDPSDAEYYDTLGTVMHLYADGGNSEEIIHLYMSATRLSPHNAQFSADLADGYDWAGRSDDALDAFQQALRLFPNSPDINWRLANFYVRADRIPDALRTLRMVLLEDGTASRKVFALATKAVPDRKVILDMLPPQAPILFDYLNFLIESADIAGAEEVWTRLLQQNLPFDLREALPYFDALIRYKEVSRLPESWAVLAKRFPAQIQGLAPGMNLITNGGFEFDILNGGLDWRVIPTEGVVVDPSSSGAFEGRRALRIVFDGSRNIDFGHVFQYLPVQPNTRYRFSVQVRAEGITTDSGPRLQLCDAYNVGQVFASTENLRGTSNWSEEDAEFTTRSDTRLLLVRVVRPASARLDNRIAGTEWIDGVSLQAE